MWVNWKCSLYLPWGICIGAASVGLNVIFISKNPSDLLPESIQDIAYLTNFSNNEISKLVNSQLKRCKSNHLIKLLEWNDKFQNLPKEIVLKKAAVLIPTVWWGSQPHNIVLVNYVDYKNGNKVYFHDPNGECNASISENEFFEKWLHISTDNDLLIISNEQLKIESYI